jgi:hypothetical protein
MSTNHEDFADDGILDDDAAFAPDPEDFTEVESSALTWDEETVRESHRDVALRARRASGRLF